MPNKVTCSKCGEIIEKKLKGKRWCTPCRSAYLREWRKKNPTYMKDYKEKRPEVEKAHKRASYRRHADKIKKKNNEYYYKNAETRRKWQREYLAKKETQNMESWLRKCMKHAKSADKKYERPFDLDIEFLLELYDRQGGRCALTGAPMTHQRHDMLAASLDRIDASKGHTKDNVQIIVSGLNRAKREYDNEHTQHFLRVISESFTQKCQNDSMVESKRPLAAHQKECTKSTCRTKTRQVNHDYCTVCKIKMRDGTLRHVKDL